MDETPTWYFFQLLIKSKYIYCYLNTIKLFIIPPGDHCPEKLNNLMLDNSPKYLLGTKQYVKINCDGLWQIVDRYLRYYSIVFGVII